MMLKSTLKTFFSQTYNKNRELSSKYSAYDELIKEYGRAGNNIDPSIMKKFLYQAHPKVSRQQNYISKISHILKSCIPHFKKNSQFYTKQQLLSRILVLYQTMNIHKKDLFEIVEHAHSAFDGTPIRSLGLYYFAIVDLNHQLNLEFKNKLKEHLVRQITNDKFLQNNPQAKDHFQITLNTLKYMLMDPDQNVDQSQRLLDYISNKVIPSMKNVSLMEHNLGAKLALIKELIHFSELKVTNEKFSQLLESAIKYYMSQKKQTSQKFMKKQNYNINLTDQSDIEVGGSTVSKNKNVLHHGQSSVFETIFSRYLEDFGYDFDKNAFIGIFEYDFLIKGKKYEVYKPFEHLSQSKTLNPISQEEWQHFRTMSDFNHIKKVEKWQHPIVLNLNGPYHYIESDVYGNQRVTRTDQIKALFLKKYGYQRFNSIHYAQWEQIHQKGVHIQKFIESMVQKNLLSQV